MQALRADVEIMALDDDRRVVLIGVVVEAGPHPPLSLTPLAAELLASVM
jgi:hypothetical protein